MWDRNVHNGSGPAARLIATIGLLALLLVLGGCSGGRETSHQMTASGGVGGQVGSIAVRDAQIVFSGPVAGGTVYQPGDDAPLQVTIVNEATAATAGTAGEDRLISVSSPIATSGRIVGDARLPDGQVLTAGYDQPTSANTPPGTTAIEVTLLGLVAPVQAGLTYPVVFTFAHAGQVRLDVPVETPPDAPA